MSDNKFFFINPLLDIKYDLNQNIMEGATDTSADLTVTQNVVSLWQKHIQYEILGISFIHYNLDFSLTYKCWFRQVEYIFRGQDDSVKEMAPLVGNQISKLLEILCDLDCIPEPPDLIYFFKNLKACSHGRIDYRKAALFLIEETKLETKKKYSLACYFCLEGKIRSLHSSSFNLNEISFKDSFRSEMFWSYSLVHKDEAFGERIKQRLEVNESNHEHLLLWAIRNENEIAIQHFWEKLYNENPMIDVTRFVTYALNFNSSYIVCFLISKMREEEQIKSLCVNEGYKVLINLSNDYFQNAEKYVLQLIGEMDFRNTLKTVVFCWIKNEPERNRYSDLLCDFSEKFHVDVQMSKDVESSIILKVLLAVNDEKISRSFLKIENLQEVKDIINALGLELVCHNYLELFKQLMAEVFVGGEMEEFKIGFFEKNIFEISEYLVTNNEFDTFDEILLYFCANDDIAQFKAELPYREQGKVIADMLKKDLLNAQIKYSIDRFLIWCFNGDLRKIGNCQNTLFDTENEEYAYCRESFGTFVKKLMHHQKFEQLEEILNWALPVMGPPAPQTYVNKYKTLAFAMKT